MTTSSTSPPARLFGLGIERSQAESSPESPESRRPRLGASSSASCAVGGRPRSRSCLRAPQRPSAAPTLPLASASSARPSSASAAASSRLAGASAASASSTVDALGVDRLRLLGRGRGRDQLLVDPPAPLGDPGRLADPAAQVVELGPAHVAARGDLEFLDLRRVQRERPLDADAEGLLADGEGLARAGALPLRTIPSKTWVRRRLPSTTWKWTRTRSPGVEGREPLPQLAPLDAVDDAAHWLDLALREKKPPEPGCGRRAVAESYLLGVLFELLGPRPALLGPPAAHPLVVAGDQHVRHPPAP